MRLSSDILKRVAKNYPAYRFEPAESFRWSPESSTIEYDSDDESGAEHLFHEIAHGVLGHSDYTRDIELIEMERDAWELAKREIAPQFDATIESDLIENDLDTYRDWLHARSTCPSCKGNGLQRADLVYKCPSCRTTWTTNQAKVCALRRYTKTRP